MNDTNAVVESFEAVKEYVVRNFPEFQTAALLFCEEADELYEESRAEQAEEGKPPRIYAHTLHHPETVCVTPLMTQLSEEQRQGIFIHEFGHLYAQAHPDEYDANEDADADLVAVTVFGVNLHYDDDDIEYVVLPIGSEPVDESPLTDEELQKAIEEIREEEEGEEEENEYGLDVPSPGDLKRSLELVPEEVSKEEAQEINDESEGTIIDAETEE